RARDGHRPVGPSDKRAAGPGRDQHDGDRLARYVPEGPKSEEHVGAREPTGGGPRLGVRGWFRWGWRQLTSMRVALMLLLLLAVVALPGSFFPQRPQNPAAVAEYLETNPDLGPFLDRIGMFDVYGSPWF